MKTLDRSLAVLLILGGIGHSLGSMKAYGGAPMTLLWSLCATLFVFFYAGVNLVRVGRGSDRALAWLCLAGGIAWIVACVRFGQLIGNVWDFRPMIFDVLTLGLCAMSIRTIAGRGSSASA